MSLESEDQYAASSMVESEHESQKRSKISYTRDFLLSFCELDICKRLPTEFEASILSGVWNSEFEEASHTIPEWQRIPEGLSSQRYGSNSLNRVDNSSNYSRGSHGRWDTRSSGSNDRDGDSLSDRDSVTQGSGSRYGNHSRRAWQHAEHDGLLGSGDFPRSSGHTRGVSTSRVLGNDNYQLNRSSEPYHPPCFKALPRSRHDATDSRDDETFGSTECSSEDRAEEERKRRATFELMRKEQQKALQEKQKHPDKHKELDNGIAVLLENSEDEKNFWSQSDGRLEDHAHVAPVSLGGSVKCFPAQAPASRPLVPPGFASAILEKNLDTKFSVSSPAPEVGNIIFKDDAHTESDVSGNDQETKQPVMCVHSHEQECETKIVGVSFMDANEKILSPSSDAEASNFSFENPSYKSSNLLEAREGWVDSAVANFDAEKVTKFEVDTVGRDQSTSILEKLFNNALAVNGIGSRSFVEHSDVKSNGDTWSAEPSQASKFAHWFLEEPEKKPIDDVSSSKARDLFSLIVSHDNGGSKVSTVSDEKAVENIPRFFPFENTEVVQKLITSAPPTSTTIGIIEPFYHSDKPDARSGVLTCEDLEQSILAEVKDTDSLVQHSMKEAWNFTNTKVETPKADVNNHASQHLLSLLQKGTISKGPTTSNTNLDMSSSDKLGDSVIGITENVCNSERTLTLETLFGTAFMKELHSAEAPVSLHRCSTSGGARTDVSEPHQFSFSIADDGLFHSSVSEHTSNKPNLIQVPQPDKIERHWLGFNDPRSKCSKLEADVGFEGRADGPLDIRLPEEESFIAVGDPLHHEKSPFMPVGSAARTQEFMSSEPPAEIVDKLAALNSILKDERSMAPGLEGPAVLHSPYEPLESEIPFQHLHGRPPSPQFPPHQMNNARPPFQSLDQHALRNPQFKFIGPDAIHHDPQHTYQPNVHHPFHGLGGPQFDPAHHSALQHISMPRNFPPHMLHGLPRGVPLPHPFNHMPGYLPEMNHIQGFPSNHQQANYIGHEMGLPGSGVGGGNHLEALERLIEMELRGNKKQTPSVAAGHEHGIYGPELDMAFRLLIVGQLSSEDPNRPTEIL